MKPTADFEDLHAQVTAHKFLINALLIAVMDKGALMKERRDGPHRVFRRQHRRKRSVSGETVPYIEEFRAASPPSDNADRG